MEGVKFDIFSDEIIDKPIPDSIEINFDKYSKMAGAPYIKKMGAVCPNGESTPFVWDGRYMRLEKTDNSKGLDLNDPSIGAIIRDVETGKIVSRFAQGCYYHSGFLDGGTFYVLATVLNHGSILAGDKIKIFYKKELINWDERILFQAGRDLLFLIQA